MTRDDHDAGRQFDAAGQDRTQDLPTPPTHLEVPLAEENLDVETRWTEEERLRLRKVVHTEEVQTPIDLRREHVEVERVADAGGPVAGDAFQEKEIDVPVMREEPVVAKQQRLAGEVRVAKQQRTETETVDGTVRREDVEVDQDGIDDYVLTPDERS